jgi:RNA polymerase sigma-70 factor (ECF subfamily)
VDRARQPDEAFRHLVDEHSSAVLAYALRRCGSPADAHDVASETFLVAWRRRDGIPGGDGQRAWLLAVARRVLSNHYRSSARRGRLLERLRTTRSTSDAQAPEARDDGDAILVALGRLRPADREILRLHCWDELTHEEIGTVLHVRPSTVAVRLSRARQRLRQEYERLGPAARSCEEPEVRQA